MNAKMTFPVLLILVECVIGIGLYGASHAAIPAAFFAELALRADVAAAVLSAQALAVAGFSTILAAFICGFNGRSYFELYKSCGSLRDLACVHVLQLFCLAVTFFLSFVTIVRPHYIRLGLTLAALGWINLAVLAVCLLGVARRSRCAGEAAGGGRDG